MRGDGRVMGYIDGDEGCICFWRVLALCFRLRQPKDLDAYIQSVCRSRTQDLTARENQ